MFYQNNFHGRAAMEHFLRSHFVYRGYANQIRSLLRPSREEWLRFLQIDDVEFFELMEDAITNFVMETTGQYTIVSVSGSPQTLVLHQAEIVDSIFRSECNTCGQACVEQATESNNRCYRCGACGSDGRINKEFPMRLHIGEPLYHDNDLSLWTLAGLRERVALVQHFDRACHQIAEKFRARISRPAFRCWRPLPAQPNL